jgi:hypothetical protein
MGNIMVNGIPSRKMHIQISLEEADGRVCFVADVVDVRSPF